MARSTNIYGIRHKRDQTFLGYATVKHEIHRLADRQQPGVPIEDIELVRFRDGQIDDGVVIPWDFEEAAYNRGSGR